MRAFASPEAGQSFAPLIDMQAARALEARTAVDDGYIWPVLRGDMVTSPNIRERMAEDLGRLLNERGADAVITTEDYLLLGWTRDQVAQHAARAGELYDQRHAAGRRPIAARSVA